MYHELTKQEAARRRHKRCTIAICAVVLAVVLMAVVSVIQNNAREQGAASIRVSILNTAMQCAAVEGAYPSTLQYLEDNYGLTINHDDYVITYEAFADNVVPSITVVPR